MHPFVRIQLFHYSVALAGGGGEAPLGAVTYLGVPLTFNGIPITFGV